MSDKTDKEVFARVRAHMLRQQKKSVFYATPRLDVPAIYGWGRTADPVGCLVGPHPGWEVSAQDRAEYLKPLNLSTSCRRMVDALCVVHDNVEERWWPLQLHRFMFDGEGQFIEHRLHAVRHGRSFHDAEGAILRAASERGITPRELMQRVRDGLVQMDELYAEMMCWSAKSSARVILDAEVLPAAPLPFRKAESLRNSIDMFLDGAPLPRCLTRRAVREAAGRYYGVMSPDLVDVELTATEWVVTIRPRFVVK